MTAPQKYVFDESFSTSAVIVDPIEELKADFARQLEEEKAKSFELGKQSGKDEADKSLAAETANAIKALIEKEQELRTQFTDLEQRLTADAIEFGVTAGTKLAGTLIEEQPKDIIEAFFRNALAILNTTPRIRAKLHPSVIEMVKSEYETWTTSADWEGTIDFIGDENLGVSDVSISWDEGGLSRSVEEMSKAIEHALNNFSAPKEVTAKQSAEISTPAPQEASEQAPAAQPAPEEILETIKQSEPSS